MLYTEKVCIYRLSWPLYLACLFSLPAFKASGPSPVDPLGFILHGKSLLGLQLFGVNSIHSAKNWPSKKH